MLAEEAMPVAELDHTALEQQASNLTEDLGLAKSDGERATIDAQLALVRAKLQAISTH